MIADNGPDDPRLLRLNNGLNPTLKQQQAEANKPATKGWVEEKCIDLMQHGLEQVPTLVAQMVNGAFHAYDRGKREAFDAVLSKHYDRDTRRGDTAITVQELLVELRAVFGVPQEQPQEPPPTTEPSEPSIEGPVQ